MTAELNAMEATKTWSVMPLPPGRHSIGCKWVYKVKHKSDGSTERYKARLVAKRYNQQKSVDFMDTFSPVAKLATVKVLLTLAASHDWHLIQLDVNDAFLHGDLSAEVYMDLPLAYSYQGKYQDYKGKLACKLQKSIYGLTQASRQWYAKFSQSIIQSGFTQSKSYYSLILKDQVPLLLPYWFMLMTLSSLAHHLLFLPTLSLFCMLNSISRT